MIDVVISYQTRAKWVILSRRFLDSPGLKNRAATNGSWRAQEEGFGDATPQQKFQDSWEYLWPLNPGGLTFQ